MGERFRLGLPVLVDSGFLKGTVYSNTLDAWRGRRTRGEESEEGGSVDFRDRAPTLFGLTFRYFEGV